MSYPRSYAKTFKATDFNDPEVSFPYVAPYRCNTHVDPCLKAENSPALGHLSATWGRWRLRVPIKVQNEMPGLNRRITSLSVQGLYVIEPLVTYAGERRSDIILLGDTAEIFRYEGLSHGDNTWVSTPLTPNLLIDGISTLDLVLEQFVKVWSGYLSFHDANISMLIEYQSDIAPQYGDLEITMVDAQTRFAIPNIGVRLLSGAKVIKSGTTDSRGVVSWPRIEKGDYMIHAYGVEPTYWSSGYEALDYKVTVNANVLSQYAVPLQPLPAIEVPWYIWAGGIVIVSGFAFLVLTSPKPTQIIISR